MLKLREMLELLDLMEMLKLLKLLEMLEMLEMLPYDIGMKISNIMDTNTPPRGKLPSKRDVIPNELLFYS